MTLSSWQTDTSLSTAEPNSKPNILSNLMSSEDVVKNNRWKFVVKKREENLAKRRGIQRGDGQIGVGLGADIDSDDEAGTIESEVRFAWTCM